MIVNVLEVTPVEISVRRREGWHLTGTEMGSGNVRRIGFDPMASFFRHSEEPLDSIKNKNVAF